MPSNMDEQQKKIMLMMPVVFTVMFIIFPFPSGLVALLARKQPYFHRSTGILENRAKRGTCPSNRDCEFGHFSDRFYPYENLGADP